MTVVTLVIILVIAVVSLVIQIKTNTILIHATDGGAKKRAAVVVSSLAVENDCRERRALAGMNAPTNDRLSCPDQTPVDVYPGVGSN